MRMLFSLMIVGLLAGCAYSKEPIPCPVCYEDEWSREAFPGQAKQHSKTVAPDDLQNPRDAARSMIGAPAATSSSTVK